MKASDVMVSTVITVGPDASVQDVAELLLRNRISAVPQVGDNGEVLGIVSEGDLMNVPDGKDTHRKASWFDALQRRMRCWRPTTSNRTRAKRLTS